MDSLRIPSISCLLLRLLTLSSTPMPNVVCQYLDSSLYESDSWPSVPSAHVSTLTRLREGQTVRIPCQPQGHSSRLLMLIQTARSVRQDEFVAIELFLFAKNVKADPSSVRAMPLGRLFDGCKVLPAEAD